MNNPNKKDAIGKGIRSLLQNMDIDMKSGSSGLSQELTEKAIAVNRIPLDKIEVNPNQPRIDFNETALKELADSIRIHDIIQPLTVTQMANGKYRLIAGERRYRAAKMADLKDVPVYIRQTNNDDLLELALLENLQREDLNAIEVALSYRRLMDELDYTQEKVADRMGKDRATVANYIGLLKVPPDIQKAIRNKEITMGHARALINLGTVENQMYVFNEIKTNKLSVRKTEALVRSMQASRQAKETGTPKGMNEYKKIEDQLASNFSTRVRMNHNKKGHGTITFEYYSKDELEGLLAKFNVNIT